MVNIHLDKPLNQFSLLTDHSMMQHVSTCQITLSQRVISYQLGWADQVHKRKDHLHLISSYSFNECSLLFFVLSIDRLSQNRVALLSLLDISTEFNQKPKNVIVLLVDCLDEWSHSFEV